jgi:hypothetical protein
MGGLLKNLTIKWMSKQAVEKSQQSRKGQLIPLFIPFSAAHARFAAHRMVKFSPTDSQHLHP